MSDNILKKIDIRRAIYRDSVPQNTPQDVKVLREIKSELQLQTDISAEAIEEKSTNAINSPYLQDQSWFNPRIIKNSPKESEWKEVKTYEEMRESYAFGNKKKLNII